MATRFPTAPSPDVVYTIDGAQYQYKANRDVFEKIASPSVGGDMVGLNTRRDPTDSTINPFFSNVQYQDDIFAAYNNNTGILQSYNGAMADTTTHTGQYAWNNSSIIRVPLGASNVATGPGIQITVPAGCDTVFIRRHVGGSPQENILEYAWNSLTATPYQVRNYGDGSHRHLLTPSMFNGPDKHRKWHRWMLPLHCDDDLGGTMFISWVYNGGNTEDTWISGIGFAKNDRNLTSTNTIELFRNDFVASSGQTYGSVQSKSVSSNTVSGGTFTASNTKIGMQVINADGRDKILVVLNFPTSVDLLSPKCALGVSDIAQTDVTYLTGALVTGNEFNVVTQYMLGSRRDLQSNHMVFRIPGELITKHVPVGTRGEIAFLMARGIHDGLTTRFGGAHLFDA